MWHALFMRWIVFFIVFTMTSAFLGAPMVKAQESVSIRHGSHDGYDRLVFDWPNKISYDLAQEKQTIRIQFKRSAQLNLSGVNEASLNNIGTVSALSSAPLTLVIDIKEQSKIRHFGIGKRVVLDVYDASGTVQKTKPINNAQSVSFSPRSATTSVPKTAFPKDPVEAQALSGDQPHVITVSTTTATGMAAFERAGFLWLVFDNPNLKVPPVIAGPKKDTFPKFKRFEFQSAVAFRLAKPEGYYFYTEAGGLLWRLIMSPNPRQLKPVKPQVDESGKILQWPLKEVQKTILIKDPVVGDVVIISTVKQAGKYSGQARQYVDLEVLPSFAGLAVVPKVDDINVSRNDKGLTITRPTGLSLSTERDTARFTLKDDLAEEKDIFDREDKPQFDRIYNFERWQMGGLAALDKNRQLIFANIGNKEGSQKVEDLLTLAKLHIANDRGPEGLGLLEVAAIELPGIDENGEFIALKGAAEALASKYDSAITNLSKAALQDFEEIGYWKAFTLAGLEDWQQADSVLPSDFDTLMTYPKEIKEPLSLALAEVALRAAKVNIARGVLAALEEGHEKMSPSRQAKWAYLNGELEHQSGNASAALEAWKPLLTGRDDYFRAKAGLSATRLELKENKITPAKAIDRLEGLRYAWRGDELETLINFRLGQVYFENNDYLKGLSTLRNAISFSPNSLIAQEVTEYMSKKFTELFREGKLDNISPLDAISIYEEFKELTPIGQEGDLFVQNLAERLVDVDLLERASALLDHQVSHRLDGVPAAKVAIRLSAIRLLDDKPEGALRSLGVAEDILKRAENPYVNERREIKLLKARALSKVSRVTEALALLDTLSKDKDVYRLLADIAWGAGRWDDAAAAFQDLINTENISKTRPMNDYQNNLVLNRAIALNLSGNRVSLANLRERYGDMMMQSDKARLFDLVTRPRQLGVLGRKDSVSNLISEVDMFGEFLESYRKIK